MSERPRPAPPLAWQQLASATSRWSRATLTTLYTALALLGLLVTPLRVLLLLGPVLAVVAAGLVVVDARRRGALWPARRPLAAAAAAGAGLPAFYQGTRLLDALGGVLAVTVLALVVAVGVHARTSIDPTATLPGATAAGDLVARDAALRALLRAAPLSMLSCRWRASDRDVQNRTGADRYAAAVHLRDLLVDELLHRDPVGTQRWLDQGAPDPLEHCVRDHQHRP